MIETESKTIAPARVAVITRTKDRPALLERALKSISGQLFRDFHWILVNDGGVVEPVNSIVEKAIAAGINVTVVHNPQSLGMEAASNRGIAESDAELLVIHDDDDTWEPDFLMATVAYLDENPDYVGVITHSTKVTERFDGKNVHVLSRRPYNVHLTAVYLIDLAVTNSFPPISFVFRSTVYDDVDGFNEELPVLGDWDFHMRVSLRGEIGLIPRPLANYHHRKKVAKKNIAYGNTVVDGLDKHHKYDAWLRNKWLREDLEAGQFGLGVLVSLGRMQLKLRIVRLIAAYVWKLKRTLRI